MPGPRLYTLFAKAGAKAACVISERGEFKGMISRKGLIETTRRYEEASDEGLAEDLGEDDEEQSLVPEVAPRCGRRKSLWKLIEGVVRHLPTAIMDGTAQLETEDSSFRPAPERRRLFSCRGRRCGAAFACILLLVTVGAAFSIYWALRPTTPTNYSQEQAVRLAELAGAAYCSQASLEGWRCGTKCLASVSKPVHVCLGDTTQAFAGRFEDDCIVSFEGTKTYTSMIQDLRIVKNLSDWKTGGSVHSGFLAEWESLQSCIQSVLTKTCSNRELVITGHSLGGAISTLAMVDLSEKGWRIKEGYTFGMPRTGDATFAVNFDHLFFGKFFRVTHHRDPVPHVPPQDFGFQHLSSEVFYDGDVGAGFRHCQQAEDLRCAGRYWDVPVDLFYLKDHMDYMGQNTGSDGCEEAHHRNGHAGAASETATAPIVTDSFRKQ
ncbi:unnamed protein product [Symbiodinium microadriaticum]|nr:unnamed protein product [Symbiodinium microadriaticum]